VALPAEQAETHAVEPSTPALSPDHIVVLVSALAPPHRSIMCLAARPRKLP
jgi:hypothetical protein